MGYSVDVIEARDRLGGRAHSVPFGKGTADLGAAWLHSTPYNPLLPLAKKTGVEYANTNFASHSALSKDGRIDQIVLSPESTTAPFETMTGPGLSWAWRSAIGLSAPDGSAGQYMEEGIAASLNSVEACTVRGLYEVAFAAELDDIHIVGLLGSSGTDPYWKPDPTLEDGLPRSDALMYEGMQKFLEILSKDIPVSLNEPVRVINWGSDGLVVESSKRSEQFDAVIVTVSIGVLKNGSIKFVPPLPDSYRQALNGLSMGLLNKVLLRYPEGTKWRTDRQFISFCDKDPVQFAVNGLALTNDPAFFGLAGGNAARAIEQATDDELVHKLHSQLRIATGIALPDPVEVRVTRWSLDPWALGSNAYLNRQATGYEKLALRQPLGGRVLFAGEAISIEGGSVDTAYFDGVRAAHFLNSG
ncbi:MAG: FAD-dependent oxidoreductase [Hyphomicrobiales bacterium]|nr:FAD-dependent oxidoreductase [Hyphomicrobiales bacterium]